MKIFFVFIFIVLIISGCSKQPVNPEITDAGIVYSVDATTNLAGDTLFAVYILNAFTPNHDGINDVFIIKGVGISSENYRMEIFNRWDNLIFETKNWNEGWNGKIKNKSAMSNTTFFYKIQLTDVFGTQHKFIGKLLLLR